MKDQRILIEYNDLQGKIENLRKIVYVFEQKYPSKDSQTMLDSSMAMVLLMFILFMCVSLYLGYLAYYEEKEVNIKDR